MHLWAADAGYRELGTLGVGPKAYALGATDDSVIVGGEGGVGAWELGRGAWRDTACRLAGRNRAVCASGPRT